MMHGPINIRFTDNVLCNREILENYGNKIRQLIRYLYTSRKLMIQLGRRSCVTFSLSLVSL